MATVTITRREAERGYLPAVCALTGEPTDEVKEKTFHWRPAWIIACVFIPLLYLIMAMVLRKQMAVRLPLARSKHAHWLWRDAVSWVLVLGTLGVFFTGSFLSLSRDHESLSGPFMLAGLGLFLLSLILYAVLVRLGIHPKQITDRDITLGGVHQNFVDALEEEREQEEEESAREEERRRDERDRRRRERDERDERDESRPIRRAKRVNPDDE